MFSGQFQIGYVMNERCAFVQKKAETNNTKCSRKFKCGSHGAAADKDKYDAYQSGDGVQITIVPVVNLNDVHLVWETELPGNYDCY